MSDDAKVDREQVELVKGGLGYNILVDGKQAGGIEGVLGQLEYIEMDLHWEDQGVARAAIEKFVEMSIAAGEAPVEATNATSEAAAHILKTQGWEQTDEGWIYNAQ